MNENAADRPEAHEILALEFVAPREASRKAFVEVILGSHDIFKKL